MLLIPLDLFCQIFVYAPLELKLWLLESFFGARYGTLVCWLVYQVSLERGSLRTITYNSTYDKSILGGVIEYIMHAPIDVVLSSSAGRYLGRAVAGALGQIVKTGSTAACKYGIITPKKNLVPLSSSWELV